MTGSVVIAGGGLAGLSLALALKQAAGPALAVTVADPAFARQGQRDDRAFAIAAAGRRMFTALGIWDAIAQGAQAITDMVVTDSRTHDAVRPVYLTFAMEREQGEPFAHMAFSRVVTRVLREACDAAGVVSRSDTVAAARTGPGRAVVTFAGGETLGADLVVAADGQRSRLREGAGIGWVGARYDQSGIVATVRHERPHQGRACEHFLPAGPFATLPLPPDEAGAFQSSIVWTERTSDAQNYLDLPADDFLAELETRFGLQLGAIALASAVKAYPLSVGIARQFVAPRLALLGDAAHVIHPIAGQGLNLGLQDAAALAQAIIDSARHGLDIGSPDALKPYERARRSASVAMAAVTDGLNRLFSNDIMPVRLARDLGLGLVDRIPSVKTRLIGEAAGWDSQPRLLRGDAL